MKRLFTILFATMLAGQAWADNFDFSAVCSSGQTLYYLITSDSTVTVTYPNYSNYYYYYNYAKPTGVLEIPSAVTYNEVEYMVTSIGYGAFYYCDSLTSVTIPNSVKNISNDAFYGCNKIEILTYNTNAIGSTFRNKQMLKTVNIGDSVTSIEYQAFSNCDSLKTIVIPNSVTTIGSSAFYDCDSLASVTIPNSVKSIGSSVFGNCKNLQYNEYDSALYLGNDENPYFALIKAKSTNITSCEINENCKVIAASAFYNCTELQTISVPNNVISIGGNAFYGISNVLYTGEAEGKPWGAFLTNGIEDGDFIFADAEKKKIAMYIGDSTDVTIPAGVTQIGAKAFYGCKLTKVIIPDSVTSIGSEAFYDCPLTFVLIPITVGSIGQKAFNSSNATFYCEANSKPNNWSYGYYNGYSYYWNAERGNVIWGSFVVNDIVYQRNRTNYDYNTGNYIYSDSIVSLIKYVGDSSFVEIPAEVIRLEREYKVTSIGNSAFSGYDNLTSITIPNSTNTIGQYAFSNCINLTSITIGDSVKSIGDLAFNNCKSLSSVIIPNLVESIGQYAFYGCSSLNSISIPLSITGIGYYAFSDCANLQKAEFVSIASLCGINFSDVTANPLYYAQHLYIDGKEVTDVVVPDSVTSIGQYAFNNCPSLTSVSIPYSVTSIGQYAFSRCYGLTSVSIPNSVTSIGSGAFSDCINLTIYCQAKIKHSGWSDKWNVSNCPVYWGATLISVTVKTENNIGGNVSGSGVYINNLTINIVATPAEGYHFVKWSDGSTENPRTIKANGDLDLSAVFDDTYRITATAQNGTISYDTVYHEGDTATITATPSTGYHFVGWSDGNSDNPRVMVVAKDSAINALFEINTYSITATAENGSVNGAATYNYGTTATLTATPYAGYRFVKWSDGNTDNPRTISVSEDLTLTAVFEANATAVAENAANAINIYAHGRTIVVENATDEIRVYDAMGRLVGRDDVHIVSTIKINNPGIYIVKTGNVVKRVMVN